MKDKETKYIERILVTRVVNGHVIQIKQVGISTEQTFVVTKTEDLTLSIADAIHKSLEGKI
jgi:hypothetical protein